MIVVGNNAVENGMLWLLSLLLGVFISSVAAARYGRKHQKYKRKFN